MFKRFWKDWKALCEYTHGFRENHKLYRFIAMPIQTIIILLSIFGCWRAVYYAKHPEKTKLEIKQEFQEKLKENGEL